MSVTPDVLPFKPIPELNSNQLGDEMFVVFVSSNGLKYIQEVDDELFAAHQPVPPIPGGQGADMLPTFYADQPAGVLGCVMVTEFCNQHLNKCTLSLGNDTRQSLSQRLCLNERQENTLKSVLGALWGMGAHVPALLERPTAAPLLARNRISNARVAPLPPNQWQQE